jgi:hypothetical protein
MPRYKMVVYSRPTPGREDEYNDWYQNVHLGELVALPGIVSARRFRHARNLVEGDAYPYMSIYEIETDDIDAVLNDLRDTAGRGALTMSDALDLTDTSALVYEEFGAEVSATGY